MSNPTSSKFSGPTHREHSDQEPLPSKPLAGRDYSPEAIEKMKLPRSEEGNTQFPGGKSACGHQGHVHDAHCHSSLHHKQPEAHIPSIKASPDHHFFNAENPRPSPPKKSEDKDEFMYKVGHH